MIISTLDFCRNFKRIMKNQDSFWHFNKFTLIVRDADDIKTILNSDHVEKSLPHRRSYRNSLLVDSMNLKNHKKLLSTLFQPMVLRRNVLIINRVMDDFLMRYEKTHLSEHEVNAKDLTFSYVTRAALPTIFGVEREIHNHEIESMKCYAEE